MLTVKIAKNFPFSGRRCSQTAVCARQYEGWCFGQRSMRQNVEAPDPPRSNRNLEGLLLGEPPSDTTKARCPTTHFGRAGPGTDQERRLQPKAYARRVGAEDSSPKARTKTRTDEGRAWAQASEGLVPKVWRRRPGAEGPRTEASRVGSEGQARRGTTSR